MNNFFSRSALSRRLSKWIFLLWIITAWMHSCLISLKHQWRDNEVKRQADGTAADLGEMVLGVSVMLRHTYLPLVL